VIAAPIVTRRNRVGPVTLPDQTSPCRHPEARVPTSTGWSSLVSSSAMVPINPRTSAISSSSILNDIVASGRRRRKRSRTRHFCPMRRRGDPPGRRPVPNALFPEKGLHDLRFESQPRSNLLLLSVAGANCLQRTAAAVHDPYRLESANSCRCRLSAGYCNNPRLREW